MNAWLKLIGSGKHPIARWEQDYIGFRRPDQRPGIKAGNYLFLYAPGVKGRRIFAFAKAVSDPEHDPEYNPNIEGSCRWKLRVSYEMNCPVASGIPITAVSSDRDLFQSLKQKSHIKLCPVEHESAYNLLKKAMQ